MMLNLTLSDVDNKMDLSISHELEIVPIRMIVRLKYHYIEKTKNDNKN